MSFLNRENFSFFFIAFRLLWSVFMWFSYIELFPSMFFRITSLETRFNLPALFISSQKTLVLERIYFRIYSLFLMLFSWNFWLVLSYIAQKRKSLFLFMFHSKKLTSASFIANHIMSVKPKSRLLSLDTCRPNTSRLSRNITSFRSSNVHQKWHSSQTDVSSFNLYFFSKWKTFLIKLTESSLEIIFLYKFLKQTISRSH